MRALRDQEDQKRLVAQVRAALADDIERGEPLQPVRLRERAKRTRLEDSERADVPESLQRSDRCATSSGSFSSARRVVLDLRG